MATWWKGSPWYTRLQTCGFTITSRRIYLILLFIRQFKWNRSCNKNLSLLQYGCCCDNDKHLLGIMSVFLWRLQVFLLYSVINLKVLLGGMCAPIFKEVVSLVLGVSCWFFCLFRTKLKNLEVVEMLCIVAKKNSSVVIAHSCNWSRNMSLTWYMLLLIIEKYYILFTPRPCENCWKKMLEISYFMLPVTTALEQVFAKQFIRKGPQPSHSLFPDDWFCRRPLLKEVLSNLQMAYRQ